MGDDEETPGLYSMELFEVVDGRIPSDWLMEYSDKGYFSMGPKTWLDEARWREKYSFWEAYFDDDPEALKVFAIERTRMELQGFEEQEQSQPPVASGPALQKYILSKADFKHQEGSTTTPLFKATSLSTIFDLLTWQNRAITGLFGFQETTQNNLEIVLDLIADFTLPSVELNRSSWETLKLSSHAYAIQTLKIFESLATKYGSYRFEDILFQVSYIEESEQKDIIEC